MDLENAIRTPSRKSLLFNYLKHLRSECAALSTVKKVLHPVEVSRGTCGAEVAKSDSKCTRRWPMAFGELLPNLLAVSGFLHVLPRLNRYDNVLALFLVAFRVTKQQHILVNSEIDRFTNRQ